MKEVELLRILESRPGHWYEITRRREADGTLVEVGRWRSEPLVLGEANAGANDPAVREAYRKKLQDFLGDLNRDLESITGRPHDVKLGGAYYLDSKHFDPATRTFKNCA
jgi:hypothetical protein